MNRKPNEPSNLRWPAIFATLLPMIALGTGAATSDRQLTALIISILAVGCALGTVGLWEGTRLCHVRGVTFGKLVSSVLLTFLVGGVSCVFAGGWGMLIAVPLSILFLPRFLKVGIGKATGLGLCFAIPMLLVAMAAPDIIQLGMRKGIEAKGLVFEQIHLRQVAAALEAYHAEQGAYPPWGADPGANEFGGLVSGMVAAGALPTFRRPVDSSVRMYASDRFAPVPGMTYSYWTNPETGWVSGAQGRTGTTTLRWKTWKTALVKNHPFPGKA